LETGIWTRNQKEIGLLSRKILSSREARASGYVRSKIKQV
jgi:hypothetical protein